MERDTRLTKDVRSGKNISLNLKLAIVIICAVIGAVIQFCINEYLCELYIEKVYMSDSAVLERDRENISDFIDYVSENDISVKNMTGLTDWQENANYMDLIIFKNDHIVFDAMDEGSYEYEADEEYYRQYYNFFPVRFKDGTYDVCIIDYSEARILNALMLVCFLISFVTLIVVIIAYNSSQMKRIITLTNEVDEIEAYKLDGTITIKGRDEIAHLAADIDDMRNRIIEQLTREQKAWQANSELVTSLAHDIRTPLTVLSGYLELLMHDDIKSEAERDAYIRLCSEKAEQLKSMSDRMFNFFFVYSGNDYQVSLEEYDAKTLLDQMLLEYVVLFDEKGFTFSHKGIEEEIIISVDTDCMKRLMDNIFSNIDKYADMEKPIIIEETFDRGELHIKIRNAISKDRNKSVSTRVGIKTCRKLAGQMGGSLRTEESNKYYMVHLVLPAKIKN